MGILPNMPSELIRLAINDLMTFELNESFEIRMEKWIEYLRETDICTISMEGAVMVETLGCNYKNQIDHLKDLPVIESNKIMAINDIRQGDLEVAAIRLSVDKNQQKTNRVMKKWWPISYKHNKERFKDNMLKLASLYEREGL